MYKTRKDIEIPAFAVFQDENVVGAVLSDGIHIETESPVTQISNFTLCIALRQTTVSTILNSSHYLPFLGFLSFGYSDESFRQVRPLNSGSDTVRYFIDHSDTSSVADSLAEVRYVCRHFDLLETDISSKKRIFFAIALSNDYQTTSNGFSATENNLIIATGVFYLLPCFIIYPPQFINVLIALSKNASNIRVNFWSVTALFCFFLLRAVLLFTIASSEVSINSTAEFALSETAVLCEFLSISLLSAYILSIIQRLQKLKTASSLQKQTLIAVAVLNLILVAMLIGFLIGFQYSPPDDGISNPILHCLGRIEEGQTFWTTKRVLRFIFSCTVATFTLLLGFSLSWLAFETHRSNESDNSKLSRFIFGSVFASASLIAQSVISLALLATGYSNFAFGIAMLWIVELVPLSVYMFFVSYAGFGRLYRSLSSLSS